MKKIMGKSYVDEKKSLTLKSVNEAIDSAGKAADLVDASQYCVLDQASRDEVHKLLTSAERELRGARRDFEKTQWASSNSDVSFLDWLLQSGYVDLVGE